SFEHALDLELVRTYSSNGREGAVQHVIQSLVFTSSFDGDEVVGLFYNQNLPVIAGGACAKEARILIGDVVTGRAKDYFLLYFHDCFDQSVSFFAIRAEDVKCEPLRGLSADTRQALKLIDKFCYRFDVIQHEFRASRRGGPFRRALIPACPSSPRRIF